MQVGTYINLTYTFSNDATIKSVEAVIRLLEMVGANEIVNTKLNGKTAITFHSPEYYTSYPERLYKLGQLLVKTEIAEEIITTL